MAEVGAAQALRTYDDLLGSCRRVASFPLSGRARPEYGREWRSIPVDPYVLLYRVADDLVIVGRILHQHRDADRLFGVD